MLTRLHFSFVHDFLKRQSLLSEMTEQEFESKMIVNISQLDVFEGRRVSYWTVVKKTAQLLINNEKSNFGIFIGNYEHKGLVKDQIGFVI